KACRRECPTGVDMARMKIEVQAARLAKRGLSLHERVIGYLPRYAPLAAKWPRLANLRNDVAHLRQWSERYAGLSGRRSRPGWRTFLAVGLIDEARREAERCVAALAPFLERAIPFVGLEPSCMLGFRDEIPSLVKREDARRLAANALLFEEFLAREVKAGALKL